MFETGGYRLSSFKNILVVLYDTQTGSELEMSKTAAAVKICIELMYSVDYKVCLAPVNTSRSLLHFLFVLAMLKSLLKSVSYFVHVFARTNSDIITSETVEKIYSW